MYLIRKCYASTHQLHIVSTHAHYGLRGWTYIVADYAAALLQPWSVGEHASTARVEHEMCIAKGRDKSDGHPASVEHDRFVLTCCSLAVGLSGWPYVV